MNNPWHQSFQSENSYILEIDRKLISLHNKSVRDESKKIIEHSIPEPYIGNPESARVVLLGLNPGHSEDDAKDYQNPKLREAMFLNLTHKLNEYPFYPLNPAFRETGAGRWWRKRTRELKEETGLDYDKLSERLMVVEWFPYHSIKFKLPKAICASQEYSFELAKKMLGTKLIVRMRSRKHWNKVDDRLDSVPSLKNPQCGYVTRRNTEGNLFDEIVKTLKE